MKVVMVHNYYRSDQPSGENTSVDLQSQALRLSGIEVIPFGAHSDTIVGGLGSRLSAGRNAMGISDVSQQFRRLVARVSPDVIHLENLYPLISPVVAAEAKRLEVPTVASVRNYRLTCAAGTHVRNGNSCSLCTGSGLLANVPAVRYACYRGRRLQTLPIAVGMTRYRSWMMNLDHYLPISAFLGRYLTERCGIDQARITIRPNSGPLTCARPLPIAPGRLLYIGRLTPEKGVLELIEAWRSISPVGWELRIAGAGPLEAEVRARLAGLTSTRFLGQLTQQEVFDELESVAAVVVPSLWDEPFGRAVVEAFAFGRPVLGTAVGGMAELLDPKATWSVEPSTDGLARGLRDLLESGVAQLRDKGVAASEIYDRLYTPSANVDVLIRTYEGLIARRA